VLAELMNKRVDMVLAIKKYPDHNRLFEETVKRRGMDKYKNEIIPTPFIFYLRVGELEDYASLYYEKDSISISSEEMKSVEKTGGFYVDGKNYVVGKNTRNGHFSQKDFKVFVHEEQHFFDRIFSDAKSFYGYEGYLDSAAGYLFQEEIKTGKKDLEKIVREVGRALRGFRTYYEWRAASEFLSYFKEGKPIEDIVDILKKNKNDGGLYDYFDREKREKIFEYVSKNFSDVGSFEIVNQVLIEEYNKILDSATEALTRLTKVGRMVRGEKVINFLQNLSLPRWLPETKKLLKGKKEKNI